jgi:Leucine-rich repeat (LRR) protein
LHGNSLQKLDVTNIPCLETLTISENRNLTQIIGFDKLDSLEELTCFNCSLEKLDCSNKKQLKKVCAANQFVDEFKPIFQGCDKLEIIDVAENKIRSLDCSDLINLKDVSCKENSFLKDNYSNIFEAFFFFFAEYDLNYEAKKNLTFENCYQGFFPFLILNVDKLINNNDKDKLLNY